MSSYRRVPIHDTFKLDTNSSQVATKTTNLCRKLRKFITDPLATPHSARHTFYELSRRAGCDSQVIETIAGHAQKIGSRTARGYGRFTDEVLKREIEKVWQLAETL